MRIICTPLDARAIFLHDDLLCKGTCSVYMYIYICIYVFIYIYIYIYIYKYIYIYIYIYISCFVLIQTIAHGFLKLYYMNNVVKTNSMVVLKNSQCKILLVTTILQNHPGILQNFCTIDLCVVFAFRHVSIDTNG